MDNCCVNLVNVLFVWYTSQQMSLAQQTFSIQVSVEVSCAI